MCSISVIMLVYNREKYVSAAIESVINQTHKDFEFIIIDNGSSDSSGEICDRYAVLDSRIKVIHKERGNIGSGRNAGLEHAKGQYITFVDDDDYCASDMLEFLYRLIEEHDGDIALCGSNKNVEGVELENCVFDELLIMSAEEAVVELLNRKKYNVAMPTKLLKRELFESIRFYETGKYDDITVGYRFFANAKKVIGHGKPKYTFTRHLNNNSNFTTNDLLLTPIQLNEYFAAFRERSDYIAKVLPKLAEFALYTEWSYMISMCNKIVSNNLEHCQEQLNHIKETLTQNYDVFYNSEYLKPFEREWMNKYLSKE